MTVANGVSRYEVEGTPDLDDLGGEPLERRVFTSAYYDTTDRRLASAGLVLRRRLENGVNRWQLTVSDGAAGVELEARGGPGGPPPPLASVLRAVLAGRPLVELAEAKTEHDEPGKPKRKASAISHVQARLAALRGDLLAADVRVRVRDDPEDVHQMRVATRRVRALLRTTRPMFGRAWSESLRSELEIPASALGTVRDLDVQIEHFERAAARLDRGDAVAVSALPAMLRERREQASAELRELLDSERYFALLDALEQAVGAPPVANADFAIGKAARKEYRRLVKSARAISPASSDSELHKLRIRGKRARYAAELVAPVRGKKTERFVGRAKSFQDLLGDHQDAVVAEDTLRRLASSLPDHAASLAAGRLVEREYARRERTRKQLPREWKRLERAGKRAWS